MALRHRARRRRRKEWPTLTDNGRSELKRELWALALRTLIDEAIRATNAKPTLPQRGTDMARPITARFQLTGRLRTVTPLHVGGYGASADTDLPLARDGAGRWYVPGTSLAGAVREWCLAPSASRSPMISGASRIPTRKTTARQAMSSSPMLLSRTTSSSRYATASASIVAWDEPPTISSTIGRSCRGTGLDLRLSIDCKDDSDDVQEMLQSLQAALEAGAVRLGAAKRGLDRSSSKES